MKRMLVVCGVVGTTVGAFKIGEIFGTIKTTKKGLDCLDEVIPGFKEQVARTTTNKIIDLVFKKSDSEKDE